MYGIALFMPRKLRICANYNLSFAARNGYKNKTLTYFNCMKDSNNNRRYTTQSLCNIRPFKPVFRNALSLSTDITETYTKKKSRKWKYVSGLVGIFGAIFFYYASEEDEDDEHTSIGLIIPSKPSEITKDWIEYMLTDYENRYSKDVNVIVNTFQVDNALKPGEGLNSQLLKIDVYASVQNLPGRGSTSYDKEYHVMIKIPERSKAMIHEMNKFIGSELKEITLYSKVIPELNKFQKCNGNEFRLKVPSFIYGKYTNKESVLVIENAKSVGYIPHSTKKEIDLNHAKVLVENLAKLHAVSYSYNKIHNFLDKFPCYKGEGIMNWFYSHPNTGAVLDNVITVLMLKDDKYSKELAVKIENSKAKLDRRLKDVVRDDTSKKWLCLTHGDCQNSNLLFKYGEDRDGNQTIDDFQFIDWQFAHWNSPMMDLQFFLNTCTTHKFRKIHSETLLEHYHSTFTKVTSRMGTPIFHGTYQEFREEYDRFAAFGLIRSLFIIQVIFSRFGETLQKDALKESSHRHPRIEIIKAKLCKHFMHKSYTSPTYQKLGLQLNALMLHFVGKEIDKGSNPFLNDRILGLVLDADKQRLFDEDNEIIESHEKN